MADTSTDKKIDRSERTRMIIGGIVIVLILWFAIANRHRVRVDFILFDRDSRMIYVIIASALLGGIADRLFLRRKRHSADR